MATETEKGLVKEWVICRLYVLLNSDPLEECVKCRHRPLDKAMIDLPIYQGDKIVAIAEDVEVLRCRQCGAKFLPRKELEALIDRRTYAVGDLAAK